LLLTAPRLWLSPLILALFLAMPWVAAAGPVSDARALLGKGKTAEAQAILEGHLAANPGDRGGRYLLANLHARSGNLKASYELFDALLRENPDDATGRGIAALFAERGATAADAKRIGALFGSVQESMQAGNRAAAVTALIEVVKLAPRNLTALHNLSQLLEQARRFDQAVPYVETLSRLRPKDYATLLRLAGLYERLERSKEAADAYGRVLKANPKHGIALFSLGRLSLFSDKDYAAAADYLARALKVQPNRPDIAYLLGLSLKEDGDISAAQAAFKRSIALDDNYFQAHFEIALYLGSLGQDEAAMERFVKVAKIGGASTQAEQARRRLALFGGDAKVAVQVKKAIDTGIERLAAGDLAAAKAAFLEVISLVPGNTLARYNLATVYTREGNNDLAVAELEKGLEGDNTHFLSHYGLALIHVGAGRFEDAFESYQQVIKWTPPDSPYAVEARSRVETMEKILAKFATKVGARNAFLSANKLVQAGDFEGAILDYEEAIKQDPEDPFYRYNAGVVYLELDRIADAFKSFQKALELKPDHIQSHFRLALFYLATQFPQQAVKSFQEVLHYGTSEAEVAEAKNRLPDALAAADVKEKALAYLLVANAMGTEFADEDLALLALERAYHLSPDAKEVVSRYAELLMQLRREDEAREMLEPMQEHYPDDSRIVWDLGQIYKTQQEWVLAETTLLRVLEIKPDFSRAATMLADVQERTGNQEVAIATLKAHLEKNPDDRQALTSLLQILNRRSRYSDAAGLVDWYLANHKEFAELLYIRGTLAKKMGEEVEASDDILTDSSLQSITAEDLGDDGGRLARYKTANEWFNRAIEVGEKEQKDARWVQLARKEVAESKRLSMRLSQTVFDFNTNANNSSTDPKAGVSSTVTLSATYTTLRTARFSLPVTLSTRHQFHYSFQTYVGTNSVSATLPSKLPLLTITPGVTYSQVRTQKGVSSTTTTYSTAVRWRPRFPSLLSGSYRYTAFTSQVNAGRNYVQDAVSANLGQNQKVGKWIRLNANVSYSANTRDVVALFLDSEQSQWRYEVGLQLTLPKLNVVNFKGWRTERENIRGGNRLGNVSPLPPPIPIDTLEQGSEASWWFQVYPKVRGKAFIRASLTNLSNVVQNRTLPNGDRVSSIGEQDQTSSSFGVEFTYRPDPSMSWVLSLGQTESRASVDVPVDLEDQLTGQVVQDNINRQQSIRLRVNYSF